MIHIDFNSYARLSCFKCTIFYIVLGMCLLTAGLFGVPTESLAICIPSDEICGNGIDEDCSGADLRCEKCKYEFISSGGCVCNGDKRYAGYCCGDNWQKTPCGGRIFYIDKNGNDSNDGSQLKPWKTLFHANKQLKAGDIILINPGNYSINKKLSIRTSGMKERPIIIRGNGGNVVLDFSKCNNGNGFEIYFANYINIENLTVLASQKKHSRGIRLTHSKGSVIRDNNVSGAGHANIFCSMSDRILIENNEAFEGQIGIYVADSTDYPTVNQNVLYRNSAIGLHMNGDKSSGGDGIISHAIVENNVVYDNGMGINIDGVNQSVFRNNILYNNRKKGIAFFKGDGAVPSEDNLLIHNTIIMPAGASYAVGLNYGAYRNKIYNNIIITRGNVPCFSTTGTSRDLEIKSDYNILAKRKGIVEIGDNWITLKKWQRLGHDKHSLQVEMPRLFVDPASANFALRRQSSAIDAGTDAHSYGKDQSGNTRPCGKGPDIGAHERCSKRYKIGNHEEGNTTYSKIITADASENHSDDNIPRQQRLSQSSKQTLGNRFTNKQGMEFVFISPGSFVMGSQGSGSKLMGRHRVSLTSAFYAQTTEVTQRQWKEVMSENPSFFKDCGPSCPVEQVSWHDAQQFIVKLNRIEKTNKYRLPTEAEWEYMCQAGTETPFSFGKCLTSEQANYDGRHPLKGCRQGLYREKPSSVKAFPPNAWGLSGMHGNVWEWCKDWLGDYPIAAVTDPVGPETGSLRVIRGGGWNSYAKACRSGNRSGSDPGKSFANLGFRVVREP